MLDIGRIPVFLSGCGWRRCLLLSSYLSGSLGGLGTQRIRFNCSVSLFGNRCGTLLFQESESISVIPCTEISNGGRGGLFQVDWTAPCVKLEGSFGILVQNLEEEEEKENRTDGILTAT